MSRLRREFGLFLCAVQMLTRLPTPRIAGFEPDWTARAARYYPLAGQIVGALSAGVLLAAAQIWGGGAIAAVLAIGAGALITGGFHEDGLADAADGLGGGHTREARLAIMKDSRVGTYGALALGLMTALRVAALAQMAPLRAAAALIFAHGLARAAAVLVMATSSYAGDPAAAKLAPAARRVTRVEALLAVGLALWPILIVGWRAFLVGAALAASSAGLVAWRARRLVGGYTGDVLGAVEQLAEAALLLSVAVGAGRPV